MADRHIFCGGTVKEGRILYLVLVKDIFPASPGGPRVTAT